MLFFQHEHVGVVPEGGGHRPLVLNVALRLVVDFQSVTLDGTLPYGMYCRKACRRGGWKSYVIQNGE